MSKISALPFLIAALCLAACQGEEDVITGGFDETIIDRDVRHGQGLRITDVDGDGNLDVVSALSLTDAVHLYLRGDDVTQPWDRISVSGPGFIVAMDVAVADFDMDGDRDIAAVGLFQREVGLRSPGDAYWYENPGDARGVWQAHRIAIPIFLAEENRWEGGLWGARALDSADFDGDGDVDLVVGQLEAVPPETVQDEEGNILAMFPARGNGVYWLRNEGDGRFTGPFPVDPILRDVNDVMVTDMDGDGRVDVMASSGQASQLNWYRNNPDGSWFRYTIRAGGGIYFGFARTNLDDDPEQEVVAAVARADSTVVQAYDPPADPTGLGAWTLTSTITDFTSTATVGIGAGQADDPRVAAADFDGDGRTDVAVNTANLSGELRVYLNRPDGWVHNGVREGYQGLTDLVAGDVDGDGRVDLVTSTYEFGNRDRVAWWRNVDL